jgi:hypothetical protein
LRLQGRCNLLLGRTDAAERLLKDALAVDRRLGLPKRIASDLRYLADVESANGRPLARQSYLERALMVLTAAGDSAGAAIVQREMEFGSSRRENANVETPKQSR